MNSMEKEMSQSTKVENRGGRREGAGRKHTTVKKYQLCATQEVADILEAVTGSKSDYICRAVIHYNSELKIDN